MVDLRGSVVDVLARCPRSGMESRYPGSPRRGREASRAAANEPRINIDVVIGYLKYVTYARWEGLAYHHPPTNRSLRPSARLNHKFDSQEWLCETEGLTGVREKVRQSHLLSLLLGCCRHRVGRRGGQ